LKKHCVVDFLGYAAALSRIADNALRPISKTGREAWDIEKDIIEVPCLAA
jgi:hypothetical protein